MQIYLLVFAVGSIMASFLNVVAKSIPIKENWWLRRSACPHCQTTLTPRELVPIFSFLLQSGRCRFCRVKISPIYFLVEVVGGFLFVVPLFFLEVPPSGLFFSELIQAWFVMALLLMVTLTDIYYQLIPNKVLIVFAIGFLLTGGNVITGLVGFLFFYGTSLLGKVLFKRETIGGGDIKLYFVIGLVLSLQELFLAILISSGVALIYILVIGKNKAIPFAPFISLGALAVYLMGLQ